MELSYYLKELYYNQGRSVFMYVYLYVYHYVYMFLRTSINL